MTTWWPAIEILITTRVTNARTEAANTSIKQTGRGDRNNACQFLAELSSACHF